MEFEAVDGKIVGPARLLDSEGRRIVRPLPAVDGRPSFDKEYIPKPGLTGRIGPYEWTIVGPGRAGVLTRNGKKIIESRFGLGGKYPWVVGVGVEDSSSANRSELIEKGIVPVDQYGGVRYYFVIDMRNDHVEYVPIDRQDEIERMTGLSNKAYGKNEFWAYFLSKFGPRRLSALEEALSPPKE